MGLTTPVLMEREDAVLPLPMCHALPLIGTRKLVKQVDIFREANEELSELGHTGHVFKEDFLARDGDMLANMKIEADNVGQRWGGIFHVAWPSPNRPPFRRQGCVYVVIPTGNGGQEGLQLPHIVLWAQRVLQGLSIYEVPGSVLGEIWVRPGNVGSATNMASGSAAGVANRWGGARLLLLHACEIWTAPWTAARTCSCTVLALVFPIRGRRSR